MDSLTFSIGGDRFMYSNNPEGLYNNFTNTSGVSLANLDGMYTVEASLPVNQYHVAE